MTNGEKLMSVFPHIKIDCEDGKVVSVFIDSKNMTTTFSAIGGM